MTTWRSKFYKGSRISAVCVLNCRILCIESGPHDFYFTVKFRLEIIYHPPCEFFRYRSVLDRYNTVLRTKFGLRPQHLSHRKFTCEHVRRFAVPFAQLYTFFCVYISSSRLPVDVQISLSFSQHMHAHILASPRYVMWPVV